MCAHASPELAARLQLQASFSWCLRFESAWDMGHVLHVYYTETQCHSKKKDDPGSWIMDVRIILTSITQIRYIDRYIYLS